VVVGIEREERTVLEKKAIVQQKSSALKVNECCALVFLF
jgi:hypothetical protein